MHSRTRWSRSGPTTSIQVIDEVVSITDRNGNQEALVTVVDFFGLTAPGIPLSWGSDVQVVYDSLHARWLALEWSIDCSVSSGINTVGHGYIDLAISDTADPLQGWTIYSKGRNDRSPIRPALGTSTDKVVVSASWTQMMDPGSTPIGCGEGAADAREITAFSWSQLLAAGTATTKSFNLGLDTVDELSAEVDFWRPAVASPATSPTIFLVGRGGSAMDGYYATITGNPSGGTAAISAAVDLATANVVAPFSDVPFALEPTAGWTLQTEAGPTSVIWQSGRLAFVSGHHCAGDRACVRVTELGTGTTTPTRRQDLLIADAAADNFGGGIAYSGTGDLHVVWTHSSEAAGDFASTYAAYHRAGDPANAISARQLLASGTETYASTVWTLRQGMAPDPQVPSAVWQGNIVFSRRRVLRELRVPAPATRRHLFADHPAAHPRLADRDRAVGQVHVQHGPDVASRRGRRDPGQRRGRDRQRDGHPTGDGGLRVGHADRDQHASVVDDQLPAG